MSSLFNTSIEKDLLQNNIDDLDDKIFFKEYMEKKVKGINFICKACFSVPIIKIICDISITISCDHLVLFDKTPKELNENYIIENIDKKVDSIVKAKDFLCNRHFQKYEYFDTDCEINLCCECITSSNDHKNDSKINFDDNEIIEKIQFIEGKIKEIVKTDSDLNSIIDKEKRNDLYNLYKLFKNILNAFEEYPCINHYKNIENIYYYLKEQEKGKELYKINNKKELNTALSEKNNKSILSININGQCLKLEKFFDNKICLENLIELN